MKFTALDWDSNFFSLKIGKLDVEQNDSNESILAEIESHSNLNLLYIFSPEDRLLDFGGEKMNLVDTKLVYKLNLNMYPEIERVSFQLVQEYKLHYSSVELETLAFDSGVFSRFRTDAHFDRSHFYRLYKEWIDKSVSKKLADDIFIVQPNFQIAGMVTVKYNSDAASIGLIAVLDKFKGMKIGSALVSEVVFASKKRNIQHIFVPTQKQNIAACKFYECNGFVKHQATHIYHYWF
jgi:dTDP-4-amino-4,6-dideoxy-D-galactose acyltransferase